MLQLFGFNFRSYIFIKNKKANLLRLAANKTQQKMAKSYVFGCIFTKKIFFCEKKLTLRLKTAINPFILLPFITIFFYDNNLAKF